MLTETHDVYDLLARKSQMTSTTSQEEAQLVTLLRQWNIDYLFGWDKPSVPLTHTDREQSTLIQRLAACSNPRLRDATISLLLLHPETFVDVIHAALKNGSPEMAEQLSTLTLATLYLQRFWSFRLTLAFGQHPSVPEETFSFLWKKRHLPPPTASSGDWGLRALEQREQERSGLPLAYRGDWQNQVDHLLWQEEQYKRPVSSSLLQATLTHENDPPENDVDQHLQPRGDREAIEHMLHTLGHHMHQPGAIYLTGEAALVYVYQRKQPTYDITLGIIHGEIAPCIRSLQTTLDIPITFLHPALTLPQAWQDRHQFIDTYGNLHVYALDALSLALSNILQASTQDIRDLLLMKQQNCFTEHDLDHALHDLLQHGEQKQGMVFAPDILLARYEAIKACIFS